VQTERATCPRKSAAGRGWRPYPAYRDSRIAGLQVQYEQAWRPREPRKHAEPCQRGRRPTRHRQPWGAGPRPPALARPDSPAGDRGRGRVSRNGIKSNGSKWPAIPWTGEASGFASGCR